MAEIPNALTDLLWGKTREEIYATLHMEHCLSAAGIEQSSQVINRIGEAEARHREHVEQRMVGPTREYYIAGCLIDAGYLNARAKRLLDTITYKPTPTR